jgi:hypothetical protein
MATLVLKFFDFLVYIVDCCESRIVFDEVLKVRLAPLEISLEPLLLLIIKRVLFPCLFRGLILGVDLVAH